MSSEPRPLRVPLPYQILNLPGSAALSPFRLERLFYVMRERAPKLKSLEARYWHFAALTRELHAKERAVLERLLSYGPSIDEREASPSATLVLVVPRLGTISPWSSKATDIAHHCGLPNIRRLERGTAWYFAKTDGTPLSTTERDLVTPLIRDRRV